MRMMTTKYITSKLNKLNLFIDEDNYYEKGLKLSNSLLRINLYNMTEVDRIEKELDMHTLKIKVKMKNRLNFPHDEFKQDKKTKNELDKIYNQINLELEPLRENLQKATKALDLYFKTTLIKATEIAQNIINQEAEKY